MISAGLEGKLRYVTITPSCLVNKRCFWVLHVLIQLLEHCSMLKYLMFMNLSHSWRRKNVSACLCATQDNFILTVETFSLEEGSYESEEISEDGTWDLGIQLIWFYPKYCHFHQFIANASEIEGLLFRLFRAVFYTSMRLCSMAYVCFLCFYMKLLLKLHSLFTDFVTCKDQT